MPSGSHSSLCLITFIDTRTSPFHIGRRAPYSVPAPWGCFYAMMLSYDVLCSNCACRAVGLGGSGAIYVGVNVEFPSAHLNNSVRVQGAWQEQTCFCFQGVPLRLAALLHSLLRPSFSTACGEFTTAMPCKLGSRAAKLWPTAGSSMPSLTSPSIPQDASLDLQSTADALLCVLRLCRLAFMQIHAEQCLLLNCLLHGEQSIRILAVSEAPCGHCRQFYAELSNSVGHAWMHVFSVSDVFICLPRSCDGLHT